MKKLFLTMTVLALSFYASAQVNDSLMVFRAFLINSEYEVSMQINFYDNDVMIPGQEIYGQLPGYLQKDHNGFCWPMTDVEIVLPSCAKVNMTNDYGSEDLTAELECINDSTYVLRHKNGSTIKVPNKGKWQKLPKTLEFKRKK